MNASLDDMILMIQGLNDFNTSTANASHSGRVSDVDLVSGYGEGLIQIIH